MEVDDEGAAEEKQHTIYSCKACPATDLRRNEVYIDLPDPDMDWQEDLNFKCQTCYIACYPDTKPMSKSQWGRFCREQWTKRKDCAQEKLTMHVRPKTWKKAMSDIDDRHPGEGRKAYRERVK